MADGGLASGGFPERGEALFGRDELLRGLIDRIEQAERRSEVVLVAGDGGTGKTSLLQALERHLQNEGRPHLPLYDFYHIDYFRPSAIEEAIVAALSAAIPGAQGDFGDYAAARRALDRSRMTGTGFREAQVAARKAFVECYNKAARRLEAGRRIVLLFDTVEQAVSLSDRADEALGIDGADISAGGEHWFGPPLRRKRDRGPRVGDSVDISAGGEHWLHTTLPLLASTVTILGGRTNTLYGPPVTLYDTLDALMPFHREVLEGLSYDATVDLARDMKARACRPGTPDANIAVYIDLEDECKLRVWQILSGGLPFWTAILFTLDLLGLEHEKDGPYEQIVNEVERLFDTETLAAAEERLRSLVPAAQATLMQSFLGAINRDAQPLMVAVQCMASVRKGMSEQLLAAIVEALEIPAAADELFGRLAGLVVVKKRTRRSYSESGTEADDREQQLFLHDELYAWLDTHKPVSDPGHLRGVVVSTVRAWHEGAIEAAGRRRLDAAEALLQLSLDDSQAIGWMKRRLQDATRRIRQLERDLLGYTYELGTIDRGAAAAMLNLLMYEAIFGHDAGNGTALRQEALRNIERMFGGVSAEAEIEFAAHWLLRAALQNEDQATVRRILVGIGRYEPAIEGRKGADVALLRLAAAAARLYGGMGTTPGERAEILALLDQADLALPSPDSARSDAERQWFTFLRAQILNFRGYAHRVNFELAASIRTYRQSERVARQEPDLLPQFRATTLRNLAYGLAWQGEIEEARRVGGDALKIHLRFGSEYEVALDRNVLGIAEIRDGGGSRALRYVEPAARTMRELGNARGLFFVLPYLAEAYRKVAEDFDDSIVDQDRMFQEALNTLSELEPVLLTVDPGKTPEEKQRVEPWRELYHTRGCTLRSKALALLRRNRFDRTHVDQLFHLAHEQLEEALKVSGAYISDKGLFEEVRLPQHPRQAPLILMDLHEDLAAIHVNQDEYDERVYVHLREAEAFATGYHAVPGRGILDVEDATRGYWKELGQCQVQRMLTAFGKFDHGRYTFNQQTGERTLAEPPGNESFLSEAGEHLVLAMAYLAKYNPNSWMVRKARQLATRELLLDRSAAQINSIDLAAFETARAYDLLYSEGFAIVQNLIKNAREDRGF